MSDGIFGVTMIMAMLASVAAWITHILVCLITGKYILLLAGALVFPVGIIHGVGIWFGVNW